MRDERVLFHLTLGECAFLLCVIGIEKEERYPQDYDFKYSTKGYSGEHIYEYPTSEESFFYLQTGYWHEMTDTDQEDDSEEDGFIQLSLF